MFPFWKGSSARGVAHTYVTSMRRAAQFNENNRHQIFMYSQAPYHSFISVGGCVGPLGTNADHIRFPEEKVAKIGLPFISCQSLLGCKYREVTAKGLRYAALKVPAPKALTLPGVTFTSQGKAYHIEDGRISNVSIEV